MRNKEQMDLLNEYYDTFNGTAVVLVNEISAKYSNLIQYPNRYLAFTIDRLYIQSSVYYFRRRSVLRAIFNEKLQIFQEAGLVDYWIEKYTKNARMKPNQRIPTELNLENVLGAFQICVVMFLFSCFVFILEIISVKIQCVKDVLDYFTH